MTDLLVTYWNFWSKAIPYTGPGNSGGYLSVFPRLGVPDGQPFPYLTYDITDHGMMQQGLDDIFIWTRQTTLQQLSTFEDAFRKAIPASGIILTLPNKAGAVAIYRGTPFFQAYPQEDSVIKAGRGLVQVNSYAN